MGKQSTAKLIGYLIGRFGLACFAAWIITSTSFGFWGVMLICFLCSPSGPPPEE